MTENLYNKQRGIIPWRYIGSDQYNRDDYLGSSKLLLEDIKKLGTNNFRKIILENCGDIDNKTLRKLESEKYLKPNKVKSDPSYYNRTEIYGPGGGQKGMKHSKIFARTNSWKTSRKGYIPDQSTRKLWSEQRTGKTSSQSTKAKMSAQRSGEKNPNALEWTITQPNGITFAIKGLRKWAKENNHNYLDIYHSRNGWISNKIGRGRGGKAKKEL